MTDQEEVPHSHRARIAMVSTHGYVAAKPSLGAADTGGQVIYVIELSKKLAQMGYEVDIYTRRFEDQEQYENVDDHVRIIRIPCGGTEFIPKEYMYEHSAEWVANAREFIRNNDLSYQFINSHYWDAGVASMDLARKLGTPHIHTPHSLGYWKFLRMKDEYDNNPEEFEKKYNFTNRIDYEKKLFRDSLAVIATSPIQADILHEEYELPYDKIKVIPPGYDETRFFPVSSAARQIIRKKWGVNGKNVIATLGRIATNKGYDLLIDAFEHVAKREPKAELHLAIGGESISKKEQKILDNLKSKVKQLNIEDRVVFSSFIPDEELADFYRMADVFVLSSRYEPFGMTAIEAMACGTPAVLTTRGGLWKQFDYGVDCLYADVLDKEDMGVTISKVIRHPSLGERLARSGAQKVLGMFTWSQVSQQLIRFINSRVNITEKREAVAAIK